MDKIEKKDYEEQERKAALIYEEFREFINEFFKETDRAAVVLGAVKLDDMLYKILKKYFISNASSQDDLFDHDGPLSTFNSKINLAYRLGLIDRNFARCIHLIRRIRNSFAHELASCSLDSGTQCERVKELVAPFKDQKNFKVFEKLISYPQKGPRCDFITILSIIIIRLGGLYNITKQVSDANAWTMNPFK